MNVCVAFYTIFCRIYSLMPALGLSVIAELFVFLLSFLFSFPFFLLFFLPSFLPSFLLPSFLPSFLPLPFSFDCSRGQITEPQIYLTSNKTPRIHSSIPSFIPSFIHPSIHSSIHLSSHPFIHPSVHPSRISRNSNTAKQNRQTKH